MPAALVSNTLATPGSLPSFEHRSGSTLFAQIVPHSISLFRGTVGIPTSEVMSGATLQPWSETAQQAPGGLLMRLQPRSKHYWTSACR